MWAVEDLLDVREDEDGEREFLVKWAGEKRKGVPWADSWEPEHFCNETAVRDFDFKVGVLDGLQLSGLDVTPLAELTRKKVADALKACKGREIACMHDLALDFLAHESLFRAFVVLASRPRARLWVTHSLYLSINHYISCHVISLPNLHNSHTTLGRG